MVKIVYCITKKEEMSDEAFHRYWRETHAPIAARIPGLRRYVQSHALAESAELGETRFDGAAEVWFDDVDALRAAMDAPETRAALDDERNFIDHGRTAIFIAEEHRIV